LSSTTDPRRRERGQILVLFAGGLVVLFIIAAAAFDLGMMALERRDQQNAADAAALAGARYVLGAPSYHGSCVAGGSGNQAVDAACAVALANDFDNADAAENVLIDIPPTSGAYRFPGFIEVRIQATRAAIFAGVMGRTEWGVGARGVASNQPGVNYSFGMLALNETACKAIHISGTGTVNAASNVQSNSTGSACTGADAGIGLSRTGSGILNVTAPDATCRSAGGIQDQGSGTMTCAEDPNSFPLPDPLSDLPAPIQPPLAAAMKEVVAGSVIDVPSSIPPDCPGATGADAPSELAPQMCTLGQGSGQGGRQWLLSPGLYPGGLDFRGGITAHLLPGIYWIGGGGIRTSNNASVISVNSETDRAPAVCTVGATPPCTGGGGVLIFNSELPASAAGPITLGGSSATLKLQPYDYPFGTTTIELVIYQDRNVSLGGDDVTLNGGGSTSDVRGIVYLPAGDLKVNGSSSAFNMDQVIAQTFLINGSGGTVNILRETGVDVTVAAVGLVE
jgi:hypothetical protein